MASDKDMQSKVVLTKDTPKTEQPAREFPSVSESEKKEYRNGYYRRTFTNVRKSSFSQKVSDFFTPFNKLQYLFVPIAFAVTLYTLLFLVYNRPEQQQKSLAYIQEHIANRILRSYDRVLNTIKSQLGDENSSTQQITQTQTALRDMMQLTSLMSAYILSCAFLTFLWLKLITLTRLAYKIITKLFFTTKTPVYILDFATLKSDPALRVSYAMFDVKSRSIGTFTQESLDFQNKILSRSCISEHTTFPPGVHFMPPRTTMENAREEAVYVFKRVVGDVLKMTNLKPKDIDILIVNCSLFCPTPSLSAMIINLFGMREDIKNYNLGGMGCSAGLISIDLARDLLQVYKNANCLVVSTENITQNWYHGNERSSLMSNTLFRMGGAAILLTNKPKYKSCAKYELVTTTRVMRGADQESYDAVYQMQDSEMKTGVRLSVNLIKCATKAVTKNLTLMLMRNPFLLPVSEMIKFVLNAIKMQVFRRKDDKPYIPNFSKIFDHFCIHAGGRKVLDDLGRDLSLGDKIKPSRAALYCFGNTSSATTWYELEFVENSGKLKKGDKVLQLAFGSGFKCNSVVWKSLQTLNS
jgi:3-ketoacyl-CoA synthase